MHVFSTQLIYSVPAFLLLLSACSGGGNVSSNPNVVSPQAVAQQKAIEVVVAMNLPLRRVPNGFYSLKRSSSIEHDYFHVRSDQVILGSTSRYDVSNNDPNQALIWSQEAAALYNPQMNFVSSSETAWFYENTWNIQDPYAGNPRMLSARVFKSAAIDRSVHDANNPSALLAVIQRLPVTNTDARFISEYLWTYSMSNNVGHLVMSSIGLQTATGVRHTISEAVFNPVMPSDVCSTVQLWNLYYDINSTNGGVTLSRSIQSEFKVKADPNGGYIFCQDKPVQTTTTEQGNLAVYPQ